MIGWLPGRAPLGLLAHCALRNEALVQELSAAFRDLHAKLKHPKVVLTVYSSAHGETKGKFREIEIS